MSVGGEKLTENTTAMKLSCAYDRLLCAIIDNRPEEQIDAFLFEYAACDSKYRACAEGNSSFEEYKAKILEKVKKDAPNYYSHRQSGKKVPVPKKSPLGRKLAKGAFSPADEEA